MQTESVKNTTTLHNKVEPAALRVPTVTYDHHHRLKEASGGNFESFRLRVYNIIIPFPIRVECQAVDGTEMILDPTNLLLVHQVVESCIKLASL